MSLNVNYNSLYKNGIDTSVLKDVSNENFYAVLLKRIPNMQILQCQHKFIQLQNLLN